LIGKSVSMTRLLEDSLLRNDPESVFPLMHNDFELTVFRKFPALEALKKQLTDQGCLASVMSGSGSTVLGIAENLTHAAKIQGTLKCKSILAYSYSGL
jgi:4-diphosphocytidyl-2-C-methyl-D-erythritol kinase